MPVLDFPIEPTTTGENLLFGPVFSAMLFPRDEIARLQWFSAAMAGTYADYYAANAPHEILSMFHSWIAVLWTLPQSPQRVHADGMAKIPRGLLAGRVLLYLLIAARHHPQHCKVERMQALVAEYPLPGSARIGEGLVGKAWAEFKTVSHLWAAAISVVQAKEELWGIDDAAFLEVLALAEGLRREGETARILTKSKMWTAPEGRVPEHQPTVPPLSPDYLAFLETSFPD